MECKALVNIFSTGCIGDCIAMLPIARALGGAVITVGNFKNPEWASQRMEGARYEAIRPLLLSQPYVKGVEWSADATPDVTHDLSEFRHISRTYGETLTAWQARYLGIPISTEPWLTAWPRAGFKDKIIVARTARYNSWFFPWPQIHREHSGRMLFVGLPAEHEAFCKLIGKVEYLPTRDMLELAEVIAGSALFIGNQSSPCWTALGMGHALIQEQFADSPDSCIRRPNAQFINDGRMPRIDLPQSSVLTTPSKAVTPTVKPLVWA